jgi:hypothetical protein
LRTAIAEGSWATDSLSEDVTDVTEIRQKVLLIKKRRKKQSRA